MVQKLWLVAWPCVFFPPSLESWSWALVRTSVCSSSQKRKTWGKVWDTARKRFINEIMFAWYEMWHVIVIFKSEGGATVYQNGSSRRKVFLPSRGTGLGCIPWLLSSLSAHLRGSTLWPLPRLAAFGQTTTRETELGWNLKLGKNRKWTVEPDFGVAEWRLFMSLIFRTSSFLKRRKKRGLSHCWELHFTLKMVIQLGSRYWLNLFKNVHLLSWSCYWLNNFPQNLLIDNNRVFSSTDDEGQRKPKDHSEQQRKG